MNTKELVEKMLKLYDVISLIYFKNNGSCDHTTFTNLALQQDIDFLTKNLDILKSPFYISFRHSIYVYYILVHFCDDGIYTTEYKYVFNDNFNTYMKIMMKYITSMNDDLFNEYEKMYKILRIV